MLWASRLLVGQPEYTLSNNIELNLAGSTFNRVRLWFEATLSLYRAPRPKGLPSQPSIWEPIDFISSSYRLFVLLGAVELKHRRNKARRFG